MKSTISSIVQEINLPLFRQHNIQVGIKRDDLIHPIISGNKWRKLKYQLKHVQQQNFQGVLSFGGCYSNHIHALAFACHQLSIPSVGIIRGEAHATNATLSQAKKWGMSLVFVSRLEYKLRNETSYLAGLANKWPHFAIIPEGGSSNLAVPGVAEVITELNQQWPFDTILTPVGSGGTLAGLISGCDNNHQVIGISVLKNAQYLNEEIKKLLPINDLGKQNWKILHQYHCGGYAKFSVENLETIRQLSHQLNIPFEPIYSGKMLLAFLDLVKQGYFAANQRIVLLHTGGLQGLAGLNEQKRINSDLWLVPSELQAQ